MTLTRTVAKPATFDEASRTVEAVVATPQAPVRRIGPKPDGSGYGPYIEVLELAGADLSRLVGAPLLVDHVPVSEFQVGVVETARRTAEGIVCLVRFSREDAGFSAGRDVADGIRRQLSVGYQVQEWSGPTGDRNEPTFTAIKWMPLEVSIVPIGADAGARFRSMPTETGVSLPMTTTTTAEVRPDTAAAAVAAERERAAEITRLGRRLALVDEAEAAVAAGTSVDAFRATALDAVAARAPAISPVRSELIADHAAPDTVRERIAEALAHRASGGRTPLSDAARQYRGMTVPGCAATMLESRNIRVPRHAPAAQIIEQSRSMSKSDLPWLFANLINRLSLNYFEAGSSELLKVARIENDIQNFNEQQRGRAGDFPALLKLPSEYSEIEYGPISEEFNSFKIERYARQFRYSFEMARNDDLGGVDQAGRTAGLSAATLEGKLIADRLNASRATDTLKDGTVVFHSTRGNVAATGAPPSIATIDAGNVAMRAYKGVNGTAYLNLRGRYIVTSPIWEYQARVVTTGTATVTDITKDNTPLRGTVEVIADANLSANSGHSWYIFPDPLLAPCLVLARLAENANGPFVDSMDDWNTDAIAIKARHCVASAWVDYRAWANPGAAS
ncbi:MAG: hypothetical protein U1E45_05690 [Geminicoccaceae bacterium]